MTDSKELVEKLGAPDDLRQLCLASMAKARQVGARLAQVRQAWALPQKMFAELLGLSRRGLQENEAQKTVPGALSLAALVGLGINANWLLTGEGPMWLKELSVGSSQDLSLDTLKLSVQLAQEALDGATLEPHDYGQLVRLIYDALAHGLPSAQVIALARPAARGISGVKRDDGQDVGGPGKGAAGSG